MSKRRMKDQAFENDKMMLDYLLGRLTGDGAEHMDERSIADGEVAARLADIENDLVDSYVVGRLVGDDLIQFESHYLATPARREKVAFARSFHQFVERHPVAADASATASGGFLSYLRAAFAMPGFRLGTAATAMAAVLIGSFWYFRTARPESEIALQNNGSPANQTDDPRAINTVPVPRVTNEQNRGPGPSNDQSGPPEAVNSARNNDNKPRRPPPNTSVVALVLPPPVRGTDLKTVRVPPGTRTAAVTLELDAGDHKSYRAVLRAEGREIWRSRAIRPAIKAGRPVLSVRVPARILVPKIYSFNVAGIGPDGSAEIIGDYAFRVVQ